MTDTVLHEDDGSRGAFFIVRDGVRVAEMTYGHMEDQRVVVDHTLVDPALRGQGVARVLLDAAVAWARKSGVRIVPACSYVAVVFSRDSTFADVQA